MREIEDALAAVKGRWMTGTEAAPAAPAAWKPLLDGKDDAELRLLALAGQVTRVAMRPVPPEALTPPPLLPALALPGMGQEARVRLRRVMTNAKNDAEAVFRALSLAEARGWAAHPADWMPGRTAMDAPALYTPWVDWQNADAEREEAGDARAWEDLYPSERRAEVARLRRADPAAARALLAEKAGALPAEERVRLVALLAGGLEDADAEFLDSLSKDRSGKVKTLAASLLARLGLGGGDAEETAELAETLEVTGGVLRRKMLTTRKLKNDAQRRRRAELFGRVPLAHLAAALDLAPREAVEIWDVAAEARAMHGFAGMVAETGADGLPALLAARILEARAPDLLTDDLLARLDAGERAALLPLSLACDDLRFTRSQELAAGAPGTCPLAMLDGAAGMSPLVVALKTAIGKATEDWRDNHTLTEGLRGLGLLADREAACALLDRFTGMDLIAADPRLDMLHLNAALEDRR